MLSLFHSCLALLVALRFLSFLQSLPSTRPSSLECFFSLWYGDSSLQEFIELLLVLCSRLLSSLCFDSAECTGTAARSGGVRNLCPVLALWYCWLRTSMDATLYEDNLAHLCSIEYRIPRVKDEE